MVSRPNSNTERLRVFRPFVAPQARDHLHNDLGDRFGDCNGVALAKLLPSARYLGRHGIKRWADKANVSPQITNTVSATYCNVLMFSPQRELAGP